MRERDICRRHIIICFNSPLHVQWSVNYLTFYNALQINRLQILQDSCSSSQGRRVLHFQYQRGVTSRPNTATTTRATSTIKRNILNLLNLLGQGRHPRLDLNSTATKRLLRCFVCGWRETVQRCNSWGELLGQEQVRLYCVFS